MVQTFVGLVVRVNDAKGEPTVILQRRGAFDYEKNKPESFAGVCQVTAHGQADGNETPEETLLREVKEELGSAAAEIVQKEFTNIKEVSRTETDDKIRITYTITLPPSFINNIQLHQSSSGLVLVKKSQFSQIQAARPEYRERGIPDPKLLIMFPDEKAALEHVF